MVNGENGLKLQRSSRGHAGDADDTKITGDVDRVDPGPGLPSGLITHGPGTRRPAKPTAKHVGPSALGTRPGDEDLPFCERP